MKVPGGISSVTIGTSLSLRFSRFEYIASLLSFAEVLNLQSNQHVTCKAKYDL